MSNDELSSHVSQLVEEAIGNKIFPCIEILAARKETVYFHKAYGTCYPDLLSSPLKKNSLFDIASLTKPLATALAILHLIENNSLSLDTSVCRLIPEMADQKAKTGITLRHLLTHTSGLPDWLALYQPDFNKKSGWTRLVKTDLSHDPGGKMVYSCLGFILLGEIVRRVSGTSLGTYCRNHLFTPLELKHTGFNPKKTQHNIPVVPTGYCELRKIELKGVVHDENAALFDGEGGNAGLFSTAAEIHKICLMLLNGGQSENTQVLSPGSVNQLFLNHNPPPLLPFSLGWDYKTGEAEYWSCSHQMPEGSIGHLGFTGTSLWLDPKSGFILIVLSNRVILSREDNIPLMRSFRPALHQLFLEYLF